MDDKIYQNIINEIIDYIPNNYEKIVLYVAYTKGSYEIKYFVRNNGKYKDCFELGIANKKELINIFANIDKVIYEERKKMSEKELWSVMTLIVLPSGQFNCDFDYKDITDNRIKYFDNWEKKYLL